MRALVAWTDADGAWIDGERADLQIRRRALGGCVAYYPKKTDTALFERLMRPGDSAFALPGTGPATTSFSFKRKPDARASTVRVVPASSWGIDTESAAQVAADLAHLSAAVAHEGWTWGRAASSIAGRILREYVPTLGQLPPRWRALAHDAIHQGPTVSVRGGATWGQEVDRTAAFLRALYDDVPVPGTFTAWPCSTWADVRACEGLIRAVVRVEPSSYVAHVPPLPVRTPLGTVHPVGTFRGAWTLPVLRAAEERGEVEVLRVEEAAVCVTEPIHADAAERMEAIHDPGLRKRVYTRYWGRLAATGGYEGNPEPSEGATQREGSGLWWTWTGTDLHTAQAPHDYRPDHAAYVAGRNLAAMGEALHRIAPGRVVGVHVDAIWLRGASPDLGPGWTTKGEGAIRWYGVGTYRIGERMGAQGFDGALTPDALDKWGRRIDDGDGVYREWRDGRGPARHVDAVSDPVEWVDLPEWPSADRPSVDDPGAWTPRGWADPDYWTTAAAQV